MVTLRNSIATHLFRVIFGFYLVVTIIVTVVQMVIEYEHVSNSVKKEVSRLPATYTSSLADALWTYNERAIRSILVGMNEIPVATGIVIDDGSELRAIGQVISPDGTYAEYDKSGVKSSSQRKLLEKLISHKFMITYLKNDGEIISLGEGIIYTNNTIIFDRVIYGFFLIVINSIVKTTALFAIFLFFMRRILSRPLLQLADQTSLVSLDNLSNVKINVDTSGRNELKIVEESFNEMISKLLSARNELDAMNMHLEDKVRMRTQDLENEVQFRIAAQKQAESANKIKTEFIANVSHEIRTPMSSIYGMARFIQCSKLDDEQSKYADIIVRNCENLMSIINEILDFSKIESGKIDLEYSDIRLKDFIENTINLFKYKAKGKNIDIRYSVHSDVPEEISADSNRLRQVISNLVNNSLKFTESGYITVNVYLDDDEADQLVFAVSDTGIGIPQDRQEEVFDSFTQGDSSTSRKYGGTGLGLSICKQFVDMFGGKMWLQSHEGEGTTFYFTMPHRSGELATITG